MNPIDEIAKLAKYIPLSALQDIQGRIKDWMASGGKHDDPYIWQKLWYAKRFVKEVNS